MRILLAQSILPEEVGYGLPSTFQCLGLVYCCPGTPFHPIGQPPRAPCPLCTIEKGDVSEKALFAVNGPAKGEYDTNIPSAYFQVPPIRLGGDDPELEALRVSVPMEAILKVGVDLTSNSFNMLRSFVLVPDSKKRFCNWKILFGTGRTVNR